MRRPSTDTVAKSAFVLSLLVFAFLYGFASHARGLFPQSWLERAWRQARGISQTSAPHARVYDRTGVRIVDGDAVQPGLTVIAASWPDGERLVPGLRLIDREGHALHEWRVDPTEVVAESPTEKRAVEGLNIHGSYLFRNGDVLVNLEYAGTLRLDACGQVLWRLPEGSHHSIHRAEDGTFWIPGVTSAPRSESPAYPDGVPGLDRPVYHDLILHVSEDGTVLGRTDVLDLLYENGLEWHLAEERRLQDEDPTHLNDIEELPDSLAGEYPGFEAGDLVLSLRNLELVLVVDPESERVKWHASGPFILQHDPDFIGDGWIGIFDNRWDRTRRGTMLGGSRIVALQPHTDSLKHLFPTARSEPFYTHHRGKWQRLANGNLLMTEEAAGRVVEVAPDGRTVWGWVAEPVGESGVATVTKATRVDIAPEQVEGWACSP